MRRFIACCTFLLISRYSTAQHEQISLSIHKTNFDYTAVLHHQNQLYGITECGHVVIWSLLSFDTIAFNHNDTAAYKFLCVAKDTLNRLYFGTDKGHVFQHNPQTKEWSVYKKIKYPVHGIFFNSLNKPIFIIANAVYDPIRKKYWTKFENRGGGFNVTKKVFGLFSKRIYHYMNMPDYTFLDSSDRLWMTASFGEFGGSVQIFDTKNYRIEDSRMDSISMGLLFPKSVFETPDNELIITSGLQHFQNLGEIYRIHSDKSVTKIFKSSGPRTVDRETGKVLDEGGLFIGPGAYNTRDKCIYFATSRGIHKIPSDLKSAKPELVADPALTWEREPAAIGMAMNIKRMEFLPDGSLMFLTTRNGIGIVSTSKVTLLK